MEPWVSTAERWRIGAGKAAEKEAAARRATDAQVLEDAERLIDAWNERQAKRMPICSRRLSAPPLPRGILVPMGALPSLPHHDRDRPSHARPSPQRRRDQSYPGAVVSLMPAHARSRSSCGYRGQASLTRCARSTESTCSATDHREPGRQVMSISRI